MKIAPTTGTAKTQAAIFGDSSSETLSGNLVINTIWNNDRSFISQPENSKGLKIPSHECTVYCPRNYH